VGHELDLIHVDELCLSRSLPRRVPCPVLVHHHKLDLEYVSAIERSTARRMLEVRRWSRLEHETLARTREHVFCCEEDAQRFAARHRQAHTHVVENGVDLEHFSPEDRPRDPDHLLALGSLDYEPNARGLETFLASAWPRLRAALPALELSIVGRGSDPHRWRHLPPGARLVGAVEDVRPWLARATALVVPLAAGGGTRLKIVEAAAMNCPVVSTRVGAEGLALEPGEHLLLAEDTESLAEPLLQALGDPAALRRRASAARERVAQRYGWSNLGARLGQIWLDVASSSSRPAPTMR
jgi:glycosyltransferase involved in cell wall biosynthesis